MRSQAVAFIGVTLLVGWSSMVKAEEVAPPVAAATPMERAKKVPTPLDQEAIEKQRVVRAVAVIGGAALGLGTALPIVLAPDMWKAGADPRLVALNAVTALGVQMAAVSVATWGLAEIYMMLEINKWLSVPVGCLGGFIAAGAAGAVSFATMMGMARALDTVSMGEVVSGWYVAAGLGLIAGAFWGSFYGFIPGAIMGPGISFYMDY